MVMSLLAHDRLLKLRNKASITSPGKAQASQCGSYLSRALQLGSCHELRLAVHLPYVKLLSRELVFQLGVEGFVFRTSPARKRAGNQTRPPVVEITSWEGL